MLRRRALVAFTMGPIVLVAGEVSAQQMTPSALGNLLAANVQAHYATTKSWTASIQQHYLAKAYNQTKDATATAVFSTSPLGTNIRQNGQQTFLPCSAPSAFFFLCGGAGYSPFTFQAFSGAQMHFPGGDVLVATPTTPSPTAVKILLYIDIASFDVRRALVIDGQGNRNRYDFR